jgi:hypothetical protein
MEVHASTQNPITATNREHFRTAKQERKKERKKELMYCFSFAISFFNYLSGCVVYAKEHRSSSLREQSSSAPISYKLI